jgi:hypothetical protein
VAGSPYAIAASDAQGSGLSNYLITYQDGRLTVDPAALIVIASDRSKTYGQTLALGNTAFTSSGLVNGDTVDSVTLASPGAAASAPVAGSPYAIAASDAQGNGLSNYLITYQDGRLTVDPAALTVIASDRSKTYGQPLALGNTAFTSSGLVNGDTVDSVTLASPGAAASAPAAGSPYAIAASDAQGSGLSNYLITYQDGRLTVDPAALTVIASDRSKTYGQTLALGNTAFTSSGLVNGDTVDSVTLASPGAAASAPVAGSPYAIAASDAQGSGLSNYLITYQEGRLTVDPAALTVVASDRSKTYGQALALGNTAFTSSGLVNGDTVDTVALASPGAAASTPVAGSPYAIAASDAQGSGLSNYLITYQDGRLTVDPAALTVIASDRSKTYGQTLALGNTAFTSSGLVNGDTVDSVALASSGAAASAPVAGSPYAIAVSDAQGSGLSNYLITYQDGRLTVDPAALILTASDRSKTYGQALALGKTAFTSSGLVNGDTVDTVALASPGADRLADAGGYAVLASDASGTGLQNYVISYRPGVLSVAPAALSVALVGNLEKTYDGTFDAALDPDNFQIVGLIDGQSASITQTLGFYNSRNVDDASIVAAQLAPGMFVAGAGTRLSNYVLPSRAEGVIRSFLIRPAILTYVADNATRPAGSAPTGLSGRVVGFVPGDTLDNAVSGRLAWVTPAGGGSEPGTYAILGSGLFSSNYQFEQAAGNARALTLTPLENPGGGIAPDPVNGPYAYVHNLLQMPLSPTMPCLCAPAIQVVDGGLRTK